MINLKNHAFLWCMVIIAVAYVSWKLAICLKYVSVGKPLYSKKELIGQMEGVRLAWEEENKKYVENISYSDIQNIIEKDEYLSSLLKLKYDCNTCVSKIWTLSRQNKLDNETKISITKDRLFYLEDTKQVLIQYTKDVDDLITRLSYSLKESKEA